MLQSTFLPASALNITEADRAAAIEVLHMLESGVIKDMSPKQYALATDDEEYPPGDTLLMSVWDGKHTCGTAACLGGWMCVVKHDTLDMDSVGDWYDVFYPDYWADIRYTVAQAAKALRAKLETGKADWT